MSLSVTQRHPAACVSVRQRVSLCISLPACMSTCVSCWLVSPSSPHCALPCLHPPPPHPICPNSPRSPSVPRYQLIKRLFNIPGAFLAELLVQEPALLGMSSALLQAKFDTLVQRCVGGLRLLQ